MQIKAEWGTCRNPSGQHQNLNNKIGYCFLSLIFFMLLYVLNIPICRADDESFFRSTNNTIPRSSLVTSLPSPEQTPNDYMQQNSIWNEIRQHLALQDQYERPEVYKWIYWLKSHPSVLRQVFQNAQPYLYYIYQQTQNYHMPAEFALLPVIESAYDPYAYSSTGAVGIWQMMPGTAMIYGLDINWWYDGRRDIITSTDRALTYLVNLKQQLNDWLLAAAAYDAGAETIQRALAANPAQSYQGSSFWRLSLSQETEDYVPKLLAISALVADPEKYGISLPYIPNKEYFSAIKINFQIDMSEIEQMAQISTREVKRLNPGMQRFATDPDKSYTLLLPTENAEIFRVNLSRLAGKNHVSWQYHEVHEGQTLESIAENYHTTMDLLRKVNKLSLNDEVATGQGLVVPLYLHRKYEKLQQDPVSHPNTVIHAINQITADDILSGNLATTSTTTTQVDNANNDEQPSMEDNLANLANENNNENNVAGLAVNNNSTVPTATSSALEGQNGSPEQTIHEQDSLQTILNKLNKTH